jgi:DNA-binding winged helix-turn-helix (wHTH) protein
LHQLDLAIIALEGLGPGAREFVGELEAQMPTLLWTPAATVAIQDQVAAATCPPEEPEPGPLLRFADYTLDVAAHSLTNSDGTELPLTRGEFSLLLEFVRRPGRVQSRDMLLHALAGRSAEAFDRSVDMLVSRLRRKIEPDHRRPSLIITVPGSGYKLTSKVEELKATAPGSSEPRTAADPSALTPSGNFGSADRFTGKPSIAVLPFDNLGAILTKNISRTDWPMT